MEGTTFVERAVARLCTAHPELAALCAQLGPRATVTEAFVAAYRASTVGYGTKSLLLRVLFGVEPVAFDGANSVARLVQWLTVGERRVGLGAREDIPRGAVGMLRTARTDFGKFMSRAFVRPYWQLSCGRVPDAPAIYASMDAASLRAALEPAWNARILTAAVANSLAAAEGDRSPRIGEWFFDTGVAALDLRNALVYLAPLLAERDRGRAQNRLSRFLSARWGLRRVSLPDAIAFADVAALALDGVIDLSLVKNDWMGLATVIGPDAADRDAAIALAWSPRDASVDAAAQLHRERWSISADSGRRQRAMFTRSDREGQFDTGFAFNAARLAGLEDTSGALARFGTYYAATTVAGIVARYGPGWSVVDESIARRVRTLMTRRASWPAIKARDLGNILCYLAANGIPETEAAWSRLPAVARFALGARAPTRSARRTKSSPASGRRPREPGRGALPVLEQLQASASQRAYLLGWPGVATLPADAPTFAPAALLQGFRAPTGVLPAGQPVLAWGTNPFDNATEALEDAGFSVQGLGKRQWPPG